MNEMEPNPDISAGVAAIKTLFHVIQNSKCKESGMDSLIPSI